MPTSFPTVSSQLAESSAHGLPRVVTASSLPLRVMWALLFTASLVGFSWHLSKLTNSFMEQPINRKVTLRGAKFEFPDLYICNPVPFSLSLFMHSSEQGVIDGIEIVGYFSQIGASVYNAMKSDNSIEGYDLDIIEAKTVFSSFEFKKYESVFNTIGQTLVGGSINGRDLQLSDFRMVASNQFLTCLQFMNTSLLTKPENDLTMYLFTDSFQKHNPFRGLQRMSYSGNEDQDKPSALVLYLVEKGTLPGERDIRVLLSAGMYTELSMSMEKMKLLNSRKNTCIKDPSHKFLFNHLNLTGGDNEIKVTYNFVSCVNYKWAYEYHGMCKCIPLEYFIPLPLREKAVRCLDTNVWTRNTELVSNLRCIVQLKRNHSLKKEIENSCHDPCDFNSYSGSWSSALWPSSSLMVQTVNDLLSVARPQRNKSGIPVPGWSILTDPRNGTQPEIVRESLLKVSISVDAEMSSLVEESLAYPLFNFFSEVGGILGLYLGVSLLTVCEVIDIIRVVIMRAIFRRKISSEMKNNSLEKNEVSQSQK